MAETAKICIDDAELVRQCRRGDSAAMERLILKYQNRIYNVILKICANVDDAAELTQDTFVKVIESIGTFEGRSSFYTWAFRIAVNLTLNYRKRNVRLGFRSLDVEADEHNWRAREGLKAFLADDSSPDPAVVAGNKELCEIVIKMLMRLDDDHRAVVILRDIEGMNYAQIAEVLEIELVRLRAG